jgi:hypothetical protein
VTHLVQQQAGYQQGSHGKATPPPKNPDPKEDAQGKQKPPCIVHAEWDPESVHAYSLAQLYVDSMHYNAHSNSYITKDVQKP